MEIGKSISESFRLRLKEIRKESGMTQQDLADAMRLLNLATVSKWERGITSPSIRRLEQIAETLGVDAFDLIGAPKPSPTPEDQETLLVILDEDKEEVASIYFKKGDGEWDMKLRNGFELKRFVEE